VPLWQVIEGILHLLSSIAQLYTGCSFTFHLNKSCVSQYIWSLRPVRIAGYCMNPSAVQLSHCAWMRLVQKICTALAFILPSCSLTFPVIFLLCPLQDLSLQCDLANDQETGFHTLMEPSSRQARLIKNSRKNH